MQSQTSWVSGPRAWDDFVRRHPELGIKPGKWTFHNFLRFHRKVLVEVDAIRMARKRFWIAHVDRFAVAAFACATGHDAHQELLLSKVLWTGSQPNEGRIASISLDPAPTIRGAAGDEGELA